MMKSSFHYTSVEAQTSTCANRAWWYYQSSSSQRFVFQATSASLLDTCEVNLNSTFTDIHYTSFGHTRFIPWTYDDAWWVDDLAHHPPLSDENIHPVCRNLAVISHCKCSSDLLRQPIWPISYNTTESNVFLQPFFQTRRPPLIIMITLIIIVTTSIALLIILLVVLRFPTRVAPGELRACRGHPARPARVAAKGVR